MSKSTRFPSSARPCLNWQASIDRLRASARVVAGLSALVLGAAFAPGVQGASDAWSTAPADGTFTGINWTTGSMVPGAPTGTIGAGDDLYFGTSSITTLNENEVAGFSISSFTFNANAAAYTIAGNAFALGAGGVTNNSTNLETINDAFTMAATSTFTTATGGGNVTLGGVISGVGGLTKAGAGTLTLSSNNTFTGGTIVNAGNLTLNAGGGAGAVRGVLTVNTGATLTLAVNNALGYTAGAQVTTLNVNGGTVNVTGTNLGDEGFITSFNLTGGTMNYATGGAFQIAAGDASAPGITSNASAITSAINGGVGIRSGTLPISVASGTTASGVDLLISGAVTGAFPVTKTGAGVLALSGANTYTGATTISAGTVQIGNGGTSGSLATSGAIVDNGVLAFNRTDTVTQGMQFSTAAITGTGSLVQNGAGTVVLNALETYTGGTVVNAGTLTLASVSGSGNVQGAITVNTGGTLNLSAADDLGYNAGSQVTAVNVNGGMVTSVAGNNEGYLTNFNLTGGTVAAGALYRFNVNAATPPGITSLASSATSTFAARIDDYPGSGTAGALTINTAAGTTASGVDLTISGVIFQSGGTAGLTGLTKTGLGTLALTGINTFTGPTNVNAGTLVFSGTGGLYTTGTTAGALTVASGATVQFNRNDALGGSGVISPVVVTVNGGTLAGNSTYTSLSNPVLNAATVNANGGTNTAFPGFSFRGTVTVGGAAPTNINVGTLGATANTQQTTVSLGTFNGTSPGDSVTFNVADATGSAVSDLNVNTGLINQSTGAVGNGLIKTGAGTMMLTAVSTYTGPTTVNAGSLIVSSTGSISPASAVTVNNAGSVIGGRGIIGGSVTIGNGAIIMAGNPALATPAVGTLTTGPLTLQMGSTFNALLKSDAVGNFSTLSATASTDVSKAAFSISLVPGATFTNGSILQLITSDIGATMFTNTAVTVGGYTFTADYTDDPGFFDVEISVVPEPASWVGFAVLGLVGVSRRKKLKVWLRAARS